MDEARALAFLAETFPDANVDTFNGAWFYSCDPERKYPFVTVITQDDDWDRVSNLDRPGFYRVNVGVTKERFREIVDPTDAVDPTTEDRFFPHPTYGNQYWISIVNPSDASFRILEPLLRDAHDRAKGRAERKAERLG